MKLAAARWQTLLVVVGSAGLLAAMAIDALAVVGRHVGLPLLGSIELIQAAVLVSGATALLCATLAGAHARVHLVLDRVPVRVRRVLQIASLLLGVALFVGYLAGSVWIAHDLWGGMEESELLHVPYRPLRVFAVAACVAVACTFLWQLLRRRS